MQEDWRLLIMASILFKTAHEVISKLKDVESNLSEEKDK